MECLQDTKVEWTYDVKGFLYRIAGNREVWRGFPKVKFVDSFFHESLAFARRQYDSITQRARHGVDDILDPLDGYLLLLKPNFEVQIIIYRVSALSAYNYVADLAIDRCHLWDAIACSTIEEVWTGSENQSSAVVVNFFVRSKASVSWMMRVGDAEQISERHLLDPKCLNRCITSLPKLEAYFTDGWWNVDSDIEA